MAYRTLPLFTPNTGKLHGLVDVNTEYGVSFEGAPLNTLAKATNLFYTSEGRIRNRPGRYTVSDFGSRTAPGWVGTDGTRLYDAGTSSLKQGATAVTTAYATPANISSAIYTDSAANTYLLTCDGGASATNVLKTLVTTDSAITGFPASTPQCVAVAGRRVFFAENNTLFWSTFSPTLAAGGEWPAANEVSFADKGVTTIKTMVEFGGMLYCFGSGTVVQINPSVDSVADSAYVVLSDFGVNGLRAAVAAKDRIFFTDGTDVYQWAPGGPPQSIASNNEGLSLVLATLRAAKTAATPYTTLGYDPFRDVLYVSNATKTLAYSVSLGAWAVWEFGATCWAALSDAMYMTEVSLTETLSIDWTKFQDTVAGVATPYTMTMRTANFSVGQDARLQFKNVTIGYPGDSSLCQGSATVNILKDGGSVAASNTATLQVEGIFTFDSSLLDGTDVLGGEGTEQWERVAFPFPRGRTLGVEVISTGNFPITLWSLMAQAQAVHEGAVLN